MAKEALLLSEAFWVRSFRKKLIFQNLYLKISQPAARTSKLIFLVSKLVNFLLELLTRESLKNIFGIRSSDLR